MLSGLEVPDLAQAIAEGDVARLTKIHGVGKKTAERLVLELRRTRSNLARCSPRPRRPRAPVSPAGADLVSALVNLGYKQAQAEKASGIALERAGEGAPFELLFKEALKGLRSGV